MRDRLFSRSRKLSLSTLLKRSEGVVPTVAEWEERRARQQQVSMVKEAPVELLAKISWLSMVCFVEDIVPKDLGLSQELVERVSGELKALEGHDILETYWRCLERLRQWGAPEEGKQRDAPDSK